MLGLDVFNDAASRVIDVGEFNRCIGEITTATIRGEGIGRKLNPLVELRCRFVPMLVFNRRAGTSIDLGGGRAQAFNDEIALN